MKKRIHRKYWNLIFKKVFNECHMNNIPIDVTCSRIRKYRKIIQRLKSYHQQTENDYRNGYETYGYNSIEKIQSSLEYISDRFGVAFRLSWLVDVPEEVDRIMNASSEASSSP